MAVLQSAVLEELKKEHTKYRDVIEEQMEPGTRIPARVDGQTIGSVTRTEDKKKAYVEDIHQVMAWASEHMPEAITPRILNMDAAIKVLQEYAPDLVTVDVPDFHRATICRRAEAGEDIPGVRVDTRPGVLQVRKQKAQPYAERVVSDALAQGLQKEIEQ